MKNRLKYRMVSMILIIAMLAAYGVPAYAHDDGESTLLEIVYPDDEANSISFANEDCSVDEGGRYMVTIVRSGDAEYEASVTLETLDISATYGEDYRIIYDDAKTELKETEGTLLEQATDYETQSERLSEIDESLSESVEEAIAAEIEETADNDENNETIEVFGNEDTYTDENEDKDNIDGAAKSGGKSSLALLKEVQTGKETRETSSSEFVSLDEYLLSGIDELEAMVGLSNSVSDMISSSSTEIIFAPGETEKTVIIEILDDNDSEGDEIFELGLANASDGYTIGVKPTCDFTIIDDEPTVYSKLSFSEAEYSASGDSVEITVTRSEALYSMCTAMVRTVDNGSAIEGVDHSMVDAEIDFKPYRTEYTFEIPIQSSDEEKMFDIELYDLKGAEAGDNTYATVTISAIASAAQNDDEEGKETAELASDTQSFTITLDKDYTVEYTSGDTVGKIYSTIGNTEVQVGDYYFTNKSTYNMYTGYDSPHYRTSNFQTDQGGENGGRAHLYWYDWRTWKNGSSYFLLSENANQNQNGAFNTVPYQYISVNWQEDWSRYSGGYTSRIELVSPVANGNLNTYVTQYDRDGQFNRTMSEHLLFLDKDNKPTSENVDVKISAVDQNGSRTPTVEVNVYGVAAMYKKFNINLEQPADMQFLGTDGEYCSAKPAEVYLNDNNERYYNQSIQINERALDDGVIKGSLTGYSIKIGSGSNAKTITYTPTGGNITNITLDDDFVKLISDNCAGVTVSNNAYAIDLYITPVYEYKNVDVEVISSTYGTFKNVSDKEDLSVGSYTDKYHVGDYLHFEGVSSDSDHYYSSYYFAGYKSKSDPKAYSESNTIEPADQMLVYEKYVVQPNFTQYKDRITIELTDEAKAKGVTILNTVPNEELPEGLRSSDSYILNTADSGYDYGVEDGEVYTIDAVVTESAPSGKVYRPVFTVSSSNDTVNGYSFDYAAKGEYSLNVVTVDVEEIDEEDLKYFEISGYTTVPGTAIRDSGASAADSPAANVTVTSGGVQIKSYDKESAEFTYGVVPISSITDSDGAFTLSGIYAKDGDTISIRTSRSDDIVGVEYLTVNSTGAEEGTMEVNEYTYDETTQETSQIPTKENGYLLDCGSIEMPLHTASAPYVTQITYTMDPVKDVTIDVNDNVIPILDTNLYVTAYVNLSGRSLKEVKFIRVSKKGETEEFTVEADNTDKDQIVFTMTFSDMNDTFEEGDMLYVSLVDSEDRTVEYTDESGKKQTDTQERRYFDVFTGLTFSVMEYDTTPQSYDIESNLDVTVPLLGNLFPDASTGSLSFEKKKIDDNSYYWQMIIAPGYSNEKGTSDMFDEISEAKEAVESDPSSVSSTEIGNISSAATKIFGSAENAQTYGKSAAKLSEDCEIDVKFVVMLQFVFVLTTETSGDGDHATVTSSYKMAKSQVCCGGSFDVGKNFPFLLYGIPVYLGVSGGLSLAVLVDNAYEPVITQSEFNDATNLSDLMDDGEYVLLGIRAGVWAGVGIYKYVGIRGVFNLDFAARIPGGVLLEYGGGFEVDLFLVSGGMHWTGSTATGVYKDADDAATSSLDNSEDETITIRNLNSGTADMSSFGSSDAVYMMDLEAMAGNYTVLLSDAAERTRPQLVTFDNGKKALFFIGSIDGEDTVNSQRLYYSICGTDGEWQTPQLVDADDTVDTKPDVSIMGNKCIVSWSDANQAADTEAEASEALASLEISYAILDSDTETISDHNTITDDAYMDVILSFECDDNGILYCYYLKQDIGEAQSVEELMDLGATYSTIAFREYDSVKDEWGDEIYVDIECEDIVDPLIVDFDSISSSHNGNTYSLSTYTIDADGDLSTVDDRDVYLKISDLTNEISYYPIRITNDNIADTLPSLTRFNDEIYLTWVKESVKFCTVNISSYVGEIENAPDEDGNTINRMDTFLSKEPTEPDWYKFTAEELGMDEEEYSGSLYERLCNGDIDAEAKSFVDDETENVNIGSYQLCNNNDKALYMLWTDNVSGEEDNSQEVFVSVFELQADSEDCERYSGWSDAVQVTDFDKTIDEVSAAFDSDGNLYFCSNLFEEDTDDDGSLIYSDNELIMFTTSCTALLEQDGDVTFETAPRPGETTNIDFFIKNNGLKSSDGFSVAMSEVQNGTETVVYSDTVESVLTVGSEIPISIEWEVPESIDELQLKIDVSDISGSGSTFTITKDIEQYIEFNSTATAYMDGQTAYMDFSIENVGNVDAEDVKVSAVEVPKESEGTSKQFSEIYSVSVPAGETIDVTIPLEALAQSDLDEYGFCDISYVVAYGSELDEGFTMLYATNAMEITTECGESVELESGETVSVNAEVMPANTSDRTVKYYSSDYSVANVTSDGVITACESGTAVITAYNPATFLTTEVTVTVNGGDEPTPTPTAKTYPSSSSSGASTSFSTSANAASTAEPDATAAPDTELDGTLPFKDVSTSDWFYDDVLSVYESGLMNGVSEDMFEPYSDMTRGMFVTTIGRAAGIDIGEYGGTSFNDVDSSEYYAPYIAWAAESAIVDGYGDNLFGPDDSVTREQAAKIIMNYETYLGNGPEGAWAIRLDYSDLELMDEWAVEGIMYCTINNIMQGNDDGTFAPLDNILRSECAAVLNRLPKNID